jgi:hypothetical protein
MNYILASSRGRELESRLTNCNTWMCVKPGAKSSQLLHIAEQVLPKVKGNEPGHVYYLVGIPDLTTKIVDTGNYQEVVFMGTPPDTVPILVAEIQKTAERMKQLGWILVFWTITPMSIGDLNSLQRTPYLIHHKQYEDMQALLEKKTMAVNHVIRAINKSNGVYTPNLPKNYY